MTLSHIKTEHSHTLPPCVLHMSAGVLCVRLHLKCDQVWFGLAEVRLNMSAVLWGHSASRGQTETESKRLLLWALRQMGWDCRALWVSQFVDFSHFKNRAPRQINQSLTLCHEFPRLRSPRTEADEISLVPLLAFNFNWGEKCTGGSCLGGKYQRWKHTRSCLMWWCTHEVSLLPCVAA